MRFASEVGQVNDGRVLDAAAALGAGIVLQPAAVLREHLDAGHFVPLFNDHMPPSRPMLLFPNRRPQPLTLRTLIDELVNAFSPNDNDGRTSIGV